MLSSFLISNRIMTKCSKAFIQNWHLYNGSEPSEAFKKVLEKLNTYVESTCEGL